MQTFFALVRGINVGGKNLVPMAELRALVAALGHADVETYIASGNVVFRSAAKEAEVVAGLERALEAKYGRALPVVVRSRDELVATVAKNPYPDVEPSRLLVMFLSHKPKAAAVARLDPHRSPGDTCVLVGRDLYAHCPNGFARTRLTVDYFDRTLGVTATGRNWRTVNTLAEWPRR